MPVIVTQPTTINVRVGSATQPKISQTTIFQGAVGANNSYLQAEIDAVFVTANSASITANNASSIANSASAQANTAFQKTGGIITGNLEVTGDIIPSTDIAYSLGSSSRKWKDLYLSGTTINLGGAEIKSDSNSGAILLVPIPTANTPNPNALLISPTGSISVVSTTDGVINASDLSNAIANSANSAPIDTLISSIYTKTNTTNLLAQASFDTANTKFASNGGIISGNVTVSGILIANGGISSINANTGSIVVTGGIGVSDNIYANGIYVNSFLVTTNNITANAITIDGGIY
jgi:hypothetical protein